MISEKAYFPVVLVALVLKRKRQVFAEAVKLKGVSGAILQPRRTDTRKWPFKDLFEERPHNSFG